MPGMNQCRPLFLLMWGGLERFGTGTDLGRCWCKVSHASLHPPLPRPHCSVWRGSFEFDKYLCKTKLGHFYTKSDPILWQENLLHSLQCCMAQSYALTFCMSQALYLFYFILIFIFLLVPSGKGALNFLILCSSDIFVPCGEWRMLVFMFFF